MSQWKILSEFNVAGTQFFGCFVCIISLCLRAGEANKLKNIHYDSDSIWHALLADIRDGRYKNVDKLPPETELATELGISRTQLRDGLSILEQNGFITRRRGIGTVINRQVVSVLTRIDQEMEFNAMVQQAGYEPEMILLSVDVKTGNQLITDKLQVQLNTPVLTLTKLVTADGRPAIFCIDYVAFSIIKDFSYTREDLSLPVFHFLSKFCNTDVVMDLTEVKPIVADTFLSEMLQIEEGLPLLYLDEVAYNIDNEVVMYCQEYYADGFLKHVVLRKKI